jgi:hypothetical protein
LCRASYASERPVSPERLDRVHVATSQRTVVLPWASRDALLEQMRHLDTMTPVVDAFEAVGASVPVRLTLEQKARLVDVVRVWADQADELPEGVPELRDELRADLHDAWQREDADGG